MCMGLPDFPSHRALSGQGSPTAAGSSAAASLAKHPSPVTGWSGSRSPRGQAGMKSVMDRCKCRLRGSEVRGGRREAAGTPSRTAAGTKRHGAPAQLSRHETPRAFIRSGCNPSASLPALHSLLQIWNCCGAADLSPPLGRGWGRRGTGWQGHGSWLGLALLPKPSRGVRRCLGSCDTSAKGDPLIQPPSCKPDPDLEGLNLSLSSLRNHFQRVEIPVLSNRWYEASNKHGPNPSPARSGQEQGLWQRRWGNPAGTNPRHLLNPSHTTITPASQQQRAPQCLPCCAPRLPDFQLRLSPHRPPSGPRLLSATAGHQPQTMAHVCHGRAPCRRCTHAHTHALTGATARPLRPRRSPSRWLARSRGR